jgi:hypothetical protein
VSDWQVGDLAVCVNADIDPFAGHNGGLTLNAAYTVREVVRAEGEVGLRLRDLPNPTGCKYRAFSTVRFRKIRPDEQQACEPEFITLLKRSKQKVSA